MYVATWRPMDQTTADAVYCVGSFIWYHIRIALCFRAQLQQMQMQMQTRYSLSHDKCVILDNAA